MGKADPGFFGVFNRGFDAFASGYAWLATRVVRYARLMMLVVYVGILAFGLNEFRKAPQGFIPQQDRGYLIVAAQIAARRVARAHRRGDAARLPTSRWKRPASRTAITIVGFSGATFTNAPNAGAIFVVLEPFAKRGQGSAPVGGRDPGRAVRRLRRSRRHSYRGAAAAGAGHRQCRRLPHDGRGSRRARAGGVAGRGRPR